MMGYLKGPPTYMLSTISFNKLREVLKDWSFRIKLEGFERYMYWENKMSETDTKIGLITGFINSNK